VLQHIVRKQNNIKCINYILNKNAQNLEAANNSSESKTLVVKKESELLLPGNPKTMFKRMTIAGKGGFGMVFSALSIVDKSKVAIKRMPHATERDKRANLREVQYLLECDQPNIVKCKAAYECIEDKEIWVVMELMEGGTLDEAVAQGYEFNEKHIAYCAREILTGLQYLHSKSVMHRDLKAANIMMSVEGEIKLIDFGLAIDVSAGPKVEFAGSPFWMPPEMIRKEPHDEKADIWSMSICILELANKSPPNYESTLKCMFNAAIGTLPVLNKPEKWSDVFRDFLSKCACFDPKIRFTATQLLKHDFMQRAAKQSDMKQILREIFMGNQLKENGFF